jgi:hypothetical protein
MSLATLGASATRGASRKVRPRQTWNVHKSLRLHCNDPATPGEVVTAEQCRIRLADRRTAARLTARLRLAGFTYDPGRYHIEWWNPAPTQTGAMLAARWR